MNRLPSTSKYHNRKTVVDGLTFASKREANRYAELKLLEKAREISDLVLQQPFILQCAFTDFSGKKHRPITYVADFVYYDEKRNVQVVEDCKGMRTDVYRIKIKLFLYGYQDVEFIES